MLLPLLRPCYDFKNSTFMLTLGLGFWFLTLAVWGTRSFRLLVTLLKTPRIVPPADRLPAGRVSIILPAKNEERNIRACVEALQNQDYPSLQLIVVNDNSTDQTEFILKSMNTAYINCPPAPAGWTGKNHALHCGVEYAKGDWFLFTDADTRHTPQSVSASVHYAETHGLDFLSLLPHCIAESFLERAIQPSAMAFLGLWFPLERVNDPKSPLYFANGQYLMIRRSLYEKLGGHQAVAGEFLEDFALMHLAKESGAKAACGFGTRLYGTRMYDSLDSIWKGWRRIYLHAFRRKPAPLFLRAFSVFGFSVFPIFVYFLCLAAGFFHSFFLAGVSTLTLGFIFLISWGSYNAVRAQRRYAIFHPASALIITLILCDAARMALTHEKTSWR